MSAGPDSRVSVVVITHNRRAEVLLAVERLRVLPERPHVIVIDNASIDGTVAELSACHPWVELVAADTNLGAVGRNIGVALAGSPYVAFCDDDTWWEPGALRRCADVLEAHPRLAVITGRIIVEPGGTEDPINAELRDSPVIGPSWLPGPALGSFLAGASVVRRDAFLACGGFNARLWLGGEEELLAADLATANWELCHLPDVCVHHQASLARDPHLRRRHGLRNTLWFTWLRRPWRSALRRTGHLLATVPRDRISAAAVLDALAGAPWVWRDRRPLPPRVERRFRALEESQRRSTARRYVS